MNVLVTGAAEFIGSHLCEKLLNDGHDVIRIDAFIESTPRSLRERNLGSVMLHPRFRFIEQDLMQADWDSLLPQVDAVYHLAGMPGVRSSWGAQSEGRFQNLAAFSIRSKQTELRAAVPRLSS